MGEASAFFLSACNKKSGHGWHSAPEGVAAANDYLGTTLEAHIYHPPSASAQSIGMVTPTGVYWNRETPQRPPGRRNIDPNPVVDRLPIQIYTYLLLELLLALPSQGGRGSWTPHFAIGGLWSDTPWPGGTGWVCHRRTEALRWRSSQRSTCGAADG